MLDLGNDMNITAYEMAIQDAEQRIEAYNMAIAVCQLRYNLERFDRPWICCGSRDDRKLFCPWAQTQSDEPYSIYARIKFMPIAHSFCIIHARKRLLS